MPEGYRVAIIGLGVIGQRMLANMGAHPRFRVGRAWDIDEGACVRARAGYPDLEIGESGAAIVGAPDTDLVYIGCPPLHHGGYVDMALAAGKAVFCEKPLGIDVTASRALVDRVERSGVPAALNFVYGSTAASEIVAARLRDGRLGAGAGVDIRLHFSAWPRAWQESAAWLRRREQGGYVREVLSHFVYLTHRLFGPSEIRRGGVRYPVDDDLTETHVVAELACGDVPVTVAGSSGGTGPDRVEFTVWGSAASYRITDWYRLAASDGGEWRDQLPDLEDPRQDAYLRQLDQLARMLDGGAHTLPSFRDGLAVQEIIERLLLT